MSTAPATVRDRTVLALVRDALVATKQFDEVLTSGLPEERGVTASDARLATLELAGWKEEGRIGTDAADFPYLRVVAFRLWLIVRMDDPDMRDDELDRLSQVASNAHSGQGYGAVCFYDLSHLAAGKYSDATGPERRLLCQGQFAYEVPGFGLRKED